MVKRRTAILVLMIPWVASCRARGPEGSPSSSPPPAARAAASAPDLTKLVGQWMRTDSDYMIWIEGVSPEGRLSARYLNPQPIHVARAEVKNDEGRLRLLVEMRDKGYPGSYYTLTYDPKGDSLYGIYHHLGRNEEFEVAFYRFDREKEAVR
jgi:hypothetical protein